MGRSRSFDEATVVALASGLFRSTGYEASSLDELLRVTGLHRGSLYQAFGSKRGLFLAALRAVDSETSDAATDLLLVALVELAPIDDAVRELVSERLQNTDTAAARLGERLLERAHIHVPTGPKKEDR